MEKAFHRPLIPLTIAMIIGILAGEAYPGYGIWVLLLAISVGTFLAILLIRKKLVLVLPILFFCCVGYLTIQPWVAPRFQSDHVWHYIDSPQSQIHGKVVSQPVYRHKRTRLAMEIESLESADQFVTLQGRVRLTIAGEPVALSKGDRISYVGRIRSIRNFNNPGGFDYERYMAYQKIWARSYAKSHQLVVHPQGIKSEGWLDLEERRAQVAGWIDGQTIWSSNSGLEIKAISKALLVGDRSDISNELRQSFNRSGVGHLLAISGLHVGIVATAAYMLFSFLASWILLLLRVGWTRKAAAILTFLPVLAYGFLAGMSPSTQRAVIMVGVFLLTLLLDRDQDLTNTICIAGAVILIIHPPALFSISFQLSFVAVLAIVWGMALIQSVLNDRLEGHRVVTKLLMFFAVSGFAILGTAPLVMVYFNQISLIGILVNMIAIPLVGFMAVPLGLLGVFFHFFIPPLANIFLLGCHWTLGQAIIIIQFFSNFPWAALETITPSRFEVGLYYLTLSSGFIWIHQTRIRQKSRPKYDKTRFVWAYIMVGLIAGGWLLDGGYWLYQRFWNRNLRVTVFDVGQGAAALLELPKGATMLIDGGGFSGTAAFDTGRNIIAPYLLRKKILSIDTMVLTHPNSDHLNGLIYISKKFKVKKAITNNQPADTMGYRHLMRALEEHGIATPSYRTLDRNMKFVGGQMEILHPPRDFLSEGQDRHQQNRNNNSIVIKVTHGQHVFLFPGDILATGERMLVTSAEDNLKSTVLISPHHGSDTSSTPLFLSEVDPEIVVISCGWQNRFGMPKPVVLNRYTDNGCRILRTDEDGAVQMWTNGEKLKINSKRPRELKATL
jgi:competence protein ComEC